MYLPGFDQGLAKIRCAEMLEEAANERADRRAQGANAKPAARRLVLALAAVVPVLIAIILVLAAH